MGQIGGALSNGAQSLGSAFTNPATFEAAPSGFSSTEWLARLMGGAGKGLAQGYGNMQSQNQAMRQGGGGGMAAPPPASPIVQQQIYDPTKKKSLFYGGE
jgi:hypothetical protein